MDSQSPSAGARPITHTTTPPARKLPDIHLDIVLVVFCGGAIGTAIRYAFAQIPAAGSFHTGTFVANMLACFCYAGLTAYLAGASRFGARSKELASRGLGMGVCGGLSTMSTLALEGFTAIRDGQVAAGIAYLLVTFAEYNIKTISALSKKYYLVLLNSQQHLYNIHQLFLHYVYLLKIHHKLSKVYLSGCLFFPEYFLSHVQLQ